MFLLDTNVVSESTRAEPAAAVVRWLQSQPRSRLSVVSAMELEYGVERASGKKRERLMRWLELTLGSDAIELIPVDLAIARSTGRMRRAAEQRGKPVALADLVIAATAQVTGSILATRNMRDFEGLGVPLFNPFDALPRVS